MFPNRREDSLTREEALKMSESRATRREVVVFEDKEALSRDAAHRFVSLAAQKTEAGERFNVALAGGSTPEMLYSLLAAAPFRAAIDWAKVHLFFGDERAVPPDHPDSNYRMANAALSAPLALPASKYSPYARRDAGSRCRRQRL